MTPAVCGLLAQVIPVFVLANVLEASRVHPRIRVLPWFRNWITIPSIGAGIVGTAVAVIGVAAEGLVVPFGVLTWVAFGVLLLLTGIQLTAIGASQEVEAEDAVEAQQRRRVLRLFGWEITSRR
ncbi:hypothetical protein [Curtobacterium sp. MCPF17_047]|uniref:hypothetical protein n=1 Tax=Curtobacterium sp. MCPF17_047 TaxID=2175654 RepID=UPI0011B49B87|nr:hypothetical protein [Curtobacterium sp. MCPF17_047]